MNRAARRRAAREARAAGGTPQAPAPHVGDGSGEPHWITISYGPGRRNVSCRKITEKIVNPLTDTVTVNSVAVEDSIHPVSLAFAPPYQDLAAAGGAKGYQHVWEKLTYAFALADPARFRALNSLAVEDRDTLKKYVAGCRKLAGYSAIAHGGGFKMQITNGNWTVTPDFPDDELIVAATVRFRQLNNQGEPTAFTTASDLIIKAAKTLDPDLIQTVAQWRQARAALLNRTIATIICDKLLPKRNRPSDFISFGNLRPEDLFNTYFYGDLLHVGDNAENLVDINSEDGNAAYHMFGFLTSMSALAHLYFGFSVLVEHAIGVAQSATTLSAQPDPEQ